MPCKISAITQVIGKMLFDISPISLDVLQDELFRQKQVSVTVMRLDKIHPVVSGNKLFKLHYFLEAAMDSPHRSLLTFGGAYSNHLLATAFACAAAGLKSTGIVRGERPAQYSHTLQQCLKYGMQLHFISREAYARKDDADMIRSFKDRIGECTIVPEGGFHILGARGAALILDQVKNNDYTHICTALGTATTLAGILLAVKEQQQVIGIPVLKGMTDIAGRVEILAGKEKAIGRLTLFNEYHFGGYAKKTAGLIQFMNECWTKYQLPLDFVYTAKMFYAVTDKIQTDHFPPGSKILCLHTGGLQGNLSLPEGSLSFQ